MSRNITSFVVAISAAAVGLLTGCGKPAEKEAEPVVPVQVSEVRRDSIQRLITAEGVLHPKDQASIVPKISAPIRKFYVNRGDRVAQGQLLALLENRDLSAAVADARGSYDQAEAQYKNVSSATVPDEMVKAQQDAEAAKQSMDASKQVLGSRQQLLREGALARRLVDEASVAYAQAKSTYETAQKHLESLQSVGRQEEVRSAAGQMASAKGKFEGAQAQLSYAEIRSPISGVVTDRPLYAGEMASSGSPLLTVMDVSRVTVRASIPISQATFIKVGDSATVDDSPAKVTVVSPAVDPQSTTVEVWVEVSNPGSKLKPGGTAHVTILAETIHDAIVIPAAALLPSQEGGTSVIVVGADNVGHEKKIEVGVREPDKLQVLKGLNPGEKVVTVGGVGLQDGTKVRITKPGEADKDEKDDKGGKDEK